MNSFFVGEEIRNIQNTLPSFMMSFWQIRKISMDFGGRFFVKKKTHNKLLYVLCVLT